MEANIVRCSVHGWLMKLDEAGQLRHVANTMPCGSETFRVLRLATAEEARKALEE